MLSALNGDIPFIILSKDTLPASIAGTNIRIKISSHKSDLLLLYSRINKQLKIIDNNAEPLFPKNKSFFKL